MNDENLQLRNCADCKKQDACSVKSPCEQYEYAASKRCKNYLGVDCVNGNCPNILAEQYPEYGYEQCSCEECPSYKGCEDCGFAGSAYCENGSDKTTQT